jgi:hypothetical protein
MSNYRPNRLFETPALAEAPVEQIRPVTNLLGGISELYAAAKLLELGHKVAVPIVDDDGVDLVVDYRIRVQVKSSKDRGSSYSFSLQRSHYTATGEMRARRGTFNADFFVCHARTVDAWWVVPRQWLVEARFGPKNTAFSLSTAARYRTKYNGLAIECREAWHLLSEWDGDAED